MDDTTRTPSLTVPIRATPAYKQALKAFAAEQKIDMADIVRQAVDAKFGKLMKEHLSFFEKRGQSVSQSDKV